MEFRHLRTFEVVASFMNFNRAAEVLHCTQSTVSAQIKALVLDLGTPVFERLGRRVALTPAGEELLRHTRRLLSYEQEIQASLKKCGETLGLLTLRVPQSVADTHLPTILRRFSESYPRVGFDVSTCGYHHLADELRSGAIDAAFLLATSVEAADLQTSVMLEEPMVYVASPGSRLAKRSKLTSGDLAGQALLLPKPDCGYRMALQQKLNAARVEVASIIELNSLAALVQCLVAGLGVAFLPRRAVAHKLEAGTLCQLDWREPMSANLYLMRHRDKPLTGSYGAFIDLVEQYFAEQRARADTAPDSRPKKGRPGRSTRRRRSSNGSADERKSRTTTSAARDAQRGCG